MVRKGTKLIKQKSLFTRIFQQLPKLYLIQYWPLWSLIINNLPCVSFLFFFFSFFGLILCQVKYLLDIVLYFNFFFFPNDINKLPFLLYERPKNCYKDMFATKYSNDWNIPPKIGFINHNKVFFVFYFYINIIDLSSQDRTCFLLCGGRCYVVYNTRYYYIFWIQ